MIAPYRWIKDYVKTDLSPEELMPYLIGTGTGVEGFTYQGQDIENVVIGQIKTIEKHPDADKLVVCMVDVGTETIQIVTGASNVFEGAYIPVALNGAKLPNGMKIKKGKLRGVESNGMLCSGEELNLTEAQVKGASEHGILILEGGTIGQDIRKALAMDDAIFEFEVEANRPDLLSVIGIAREVAAAIDTDLHMPEIKYSENDEDIHAYVDVSVLNPEFCPRYIARAIKNIKIEESPDWLKKRLRSTGVRPISNIVDITNFIMLETGQPMHAFDAADIGGDKINVRTAKKGEMITTLDDKERTLSERNLLICDADHPIGIGGIMGGQNSEIKDTTKTVIFESANFTYGNIRQSSRELGLSTEASMRYSKGVDPAVAKLAMDRALTLVEMLGAGEIVGGEIDVLNCDLTPKTVVVTADRVNALLGTNIPIGEMTRILNRLEIETTDDGTTLTSKIPSFRAMDMGQGADIAEEVARMYGYDKIEEALMTGAVAAGEIPFHESCNDRLKALLVNNGYYEASTYSFFGMSELDKLNLSADDPLRKMVRLLNPLGEEYAYMRSTPIPEMLKVLARNINMKQKDIRMFETGRVYLPDKTPIDDLPDEKAFLCLGVSGKDEDFYTVKGTLENIIEAFGVKEARFEFGGPDYYHPGRKAVIRVNDTAVGELGEVHPDVLKNFEVTERAYIAYICLDDLYQYADDTHVFTPLPRYPAAERDIALIVKDGVEAGVLEALIQQNGGSYLESTVLFDVYKGKPLADDEKSIAFSMIFRAPDRTLTDEEANEAVGRITSAAKAAFNAEIRQ